MAHPRRGLARLVVMLVLLAAPPPASAQSVAWKMANEYPATSIQGEADARFAREVAARTGGRVEITHQYDASSGFRSREMVDAIARGALVLGNTYMGALGGVDPVFLLPSLPFLATTPEIPAYEGFWHPAWSVLPVSAVTELAAVTLFGANLLLTFTRTPAHLARG